jgi:hypothetical protein
MEEPQKPPHNRVFYLLLIALVVVSLTTYSLATIIARLVVPELSENVGKIARLKEAAQLAQVAPEVGVAPPEVLRAYTLGFQQGNLTAEVLTLGLERGVPLPSEYVIPEMTLDELALARGTPTAVYASADAADPDHLLRNAYGFGYTAGLQVYPEETAPALTAGPVSLLSGDLAANLSEAGFFASPEEEPVSPQAGGCVPPCPPGTYCDDFTNSCQPNRCDSDDQCGENEKCDPKIGCVFCSDAGGSQCSADAHCQEGYRCVHCKCVRRGFDKPPPFKDTPLSCKPTLSLSSAGCKCKKGPLSFSIRYNWDNSTAGCTVGLRW